MSAPVVRGPSFQIKRISPRASQERFPGGFRISPRDPLETTKGRAAALPLETIPGYGGFHYEGRWDGGREMGAECLLSFRTPCLAADEVVDDLVVLEPALGGHRPPGDGGRHAYLGHSLRRPNSGTEFGASVKSSCPTGGCGKPQAFACTLRLRNRSVGKPARCSLSHHKDASSHGETVAADRETAAPAG